ncbi:hypothetical protein GGR53DRAFT_210554 [Hypoxylon sp. FL1150]|nr:hypothetical protein GGR53DRAFT_210554 [Hypoxylon sp. FL1150]
MQYLPPPEIAPHYCQPGPNFVPKDAYQYFIGDGKGPLAKPYQLRLWRQLHYGEDLRCDSCLIYNMPPAGCRFTSPTRCVNCELYGNACTKLGDLSRAPEPANPNAGQASGSVPSGPPPAPGQPPGPSPGYPMLFSSPLPGPGPPPGPSSFAQPSSGSGPSFNFQFGPQSGPSQSGPSQSGPSQSGPSSFAPPSSGSGPSFGFPFGPPSGPSQSGPSQSGPSQSGPSPPPIFSPQSGPGLPDSPAMNPFSGPSPTPAPPPTSVDPPSRRDAPQWPANMSPARMWRNAPLTRCNSCRTKQRQGCDANVDTPPGLGCTRCKLDDIPCQWMVDTALVITLAPRPDGMIMPICCDTCLRSEGIRTCSWLNKKGRVMGTQGDFYTKCINCRNKQIDCTYLNVQSNLISRLGYTHYTLTRTLPPIGQRPELQMEKQGNPVERYVPRSVRRRSASPEREPRPKPPVADADLEPAIYVHDVDTSGDPNRTSTGGGPACDLCKKRCNVQGNPNCNVNFVTNKGCRWCSLWGTICVVNGQSFSSMSGRSLTYPYARCYNCRKKGRNCERKRPCDSCVMNGEECFTQGESLNNCFFRGVPGDNMPSYYRKHGYGATGVNSSPATTQTRSGKNYHLSWRPEHLGLLPEQRLGLALAGSKGKGTGAVSDPAGPSGSVPSGSVPSGAGTSGAGTSGAGTSGAGTSGAGTSGAGTSGAGLSGTGFSGVGPNGAGLSNTGATGAAPSPAGPSSTVGPGAGITASPNGGVDPTSAGVGPGPGPSNAGSAAPSPNFDMADFHDGTDAPFEDEDKNTDPLRQAGSHEPRGHSPAGPSNSPAVPPASAALDNCYNILLNQLPEDQERDEIRIHDEIRDDQIMNMTIFNGDAERTALGNEEVDEYNQLFEIAQTLVSVMSQIIDLRALRRRIRVDMLLRVPFALSQASHCIGLFLQSRRECRIQDNPMSCDVVLPANAPQLGNFPETINPGNQQIQSINYEPAFRPPSPGPRIAAFHLTSSDAQDPEVQDNSAEFPEDHIARVNMSLLVRPVPRELNPTSEPVFPTIPYARLYTDGRLGHGRASGCMNIINGQRCGANATSCCEDTIHCNEFYICDTCNSQSRDQLRPAVEQHINELRAYFCAPCAYAATQPGHFKGIDLRVWGADVASPSPNAHPPFLDRGGFQGEPLPMSGCACASKLLDRYLCPPHRLQHFVNLLARMATMARWVEQVWGRRICPSCRALPPVSAFNFSGDQGGELLPVTWQCIGCHDVVVQPREPPPFQAEPFDENQMDIDVDWDNQPMLGIVSEVMGGVNFQLSQAATPPEYNFGDYIVPEALEEL